MVLPPIITGFVKQYPSITLEIVAEDRMVDIVAEGFDAGVRYDERLEQDMIAVPLGTRVERYLVAAAPAYWADHPKPHHPRDLLNHACILHRAIDRPASAWTFARDGEEISVDPPGVIVANTLGLMLRTALSGLGVVASFEQHLAPHLASGALEPVLEEWWPNFTGPFIYFADRRKMRPPLRPFFDFLRETAS